MIFSFLLINMVLIFIFLFDLPSSVPDGRSRQTAITDRFGCFI